MSDDETCKDKNGEICKDKIFDYALGWFIYHAGQRVQIFQAFTYFVGFLYASYALSVNTNSFIVTVFIAFSIIFASFVFIFLDIRNTHLVELGQIALKKMENSPEFSKYEAEFQILERDKKTRNKWFNHRYLVRSMYIVNIIFVFIMTILLNKSHI